MAVFTDEAGTYDLTITTPADYDIQTTSGSVLPNDDPCMTVVDFGTVDPTYNLNGDDFDITDGTAWTIEFWFWYSSPVFLSGNCILENAVPSRTGANDYAWALFFTTTGRIEFYTVNTAGGLWLPILDSSVLSGSVWYHVAVVKETGNTTKVYLQGTLDVTATGSPTGTRCTPTGSFRLHAFTDGSGGSDFNNAGNGMRIAKLAIYNRALTTGEMADHILSMNA